MSVKWFVDLLWGKKVLGGLFDRENDASKGAKLSLLLSGNWKKAVSEFIAGEASKYDSWGELMAFSYDCVWWSPGDEMSSLLSETSLPDSGGEGKIQPGVMILFVSLWGLYNYKNHTHQN